MHHLEESLSLNIASRGNQVSISGVPKHVDLAEEVLLTLWDKIQKKQDVTTSEIDAALRFSKEGKLRDFSFSFFICSHILSEIA
mgnify:CR=1 FL=1